MLASHSLPRQPAALPHKPWHNTEPNIGCTITQPSLKQPAAPLPILSPCRVNRNPDPLPSPTPRAFSRIAPLPSPKPHTSLAGSVPLPSPEPRAPFAGSALLKWLTLCEIYPVEAISPLQKQKSRLFCNFFAIRGPFPTKKSWDRTAIQLITWYFASQPAIGKL